MSGKRSQKTYLCGILAGLLMAAFCHGNVKAAVPVYPQEELSGETATFTMPVISYATDHSASGASEGKSSPLEGKSAPAAGDSSPSQGKSERPHPAPEPGTGASNGQGQTPGGTDNAGNGSGAGSTEPAASGKDAGAGASDRNGAEGKCTGSAATTGKSGKQSGSVASTGTTRSAQAASSGRSSTAQAGNTARTGSSGNASESDSAQTGAFRTQVVKHTLDEGADVPEETDTSEEAEKEPAWIIRFFRGFTWWMWLLFIAILLALVFLFWFFLIRTGRIADWWYLFSARFRRDGFEDEEEIDENGDGQDIAGQGMAEHPADTDGADMADAAQTAEEEARPEDGADAEPAEEPGLETEPRTESRTEPETEAKTESKTAQDAEADGEQDGDWLEAIDIADLMPHQKKAQPAGPDRYDSTMDALIRKRQTREDTAIREEEKEASVRQNLKELEEGLARNMIAQEQEPVSSEHDDAELVRAKQAAIRQRKLEEERRERLKKRQKMRRGEDRR